MGGEGLGQAGYEKDTGSVESASARVPAFVRSMHARMDRIIKAGE